MEQYTDLRELCSCPRDYDITSINRQGECAIQRVAGDNIALCEALSAEP